MFAKTNVNALIFSYWQAIQFTHCLFSKCWCN